jgi:endonuclease/exonuclease/phosphatase family metal-dependent hydrolase
MVPETVTVYQYQEGTAVYAGDRLVGHGRDVSVQHVLGWLNVPHQVRVVAGEGEMPILQRRDGFFVTSHPPESLREVEAHFAGLTERRRLGRIAALEAELARLKAEADAPAVVEGGG